MVDTKLIDLLPEKMSDEAAYHLVNFMSNLAVELENHYYVQLKRHTENSSEYVDF